MDVTLSSVLWWSPQHAGFSQRLQPPPSPPLCAAQTILGLLLSFSQSQVSASLGGHGQVQPRDGMGPCPPANSMSVCPSCSHARVILCNLENGCSGPGGDPPLPATAFRIIHIVVPKMPGGLWAFFKLLQPQPNPP